MERSVPAAGRAVRTGGKQHAIGWILRPEWADAYDAPPTEKPVSYLKAKAGRIVNRMRCRLVKRLIPYNCNLKTSATM